MLNVRRRSHGCRAVRDVSVEDYQSSLVCGEITLQDAKIACDQSSCAFMLAMGTIIFDGSGTSPSE